jgi:hypothetical protein
MNRNRRKTLFLIVFTMAFLVSATPVLPSARSTGSAPPSIERSSLKSIYERQTARNCSIDGNQDLYGIGVRSGIYLQAWASMFTLAFGFDKASNALSTSIWFQVALFIALIYTSAMKTIYASEAVIAMLLLALLQIFDAMLICSTVIHVLSARLLRPRSRILEMVEFEYNVTNVGREKIGMYGEGGMGHEKHDCKGEGEIQMNPETPARANEGTSVPDADSPATRQRNRIHRESIRAKRGSPDFSGDLFQLVMDDFKDEAELASIIEKWVYYTRNGNLFFCCLVALLILAGVLYATWFWWVGMSHLQPSPCESYAAFLGIRFDIFGGIRWPTRVFLVIALLIFGFLYLLWVPVILLVQFLISEIVFYRCGK